MYKKIEKQILDFVKEYPAIDRYEMVHGTLYVKFADARICDFFHKELRKHYKENINTEGGVNMYAVGEEFAFDFVPEDREAPVFTEEDETGVWSEFAEEELENNMPDDVDTLLNLEAESKRGK